MIDIGVCITRKDIVKAGRRLVEEGGLRPQWVKLPENADLIDETNKKSSEVIRVLKAI
ncbi:MAG: hypothetical protein N3I35_13250 [Clostridia bacterium]|nr:hypothetical protein [Clostridia bacterium]